MRGSSDYYGPLSPPVVSVWSNEEIAMGIWLSILEVWNRQAFSVSQRQLLWFPSWFWSLNVSGWLDESANRKRQDTGLLVYNTILWEEGIKGKAAFTQEKKF